MLRSRLLFGTLAIVAAGAISIAAVRPAALFGQDMMPKPTEEHTLLQKSVGTYEGTVTMHVPGLPQDPVPATDTISALGKFWTTSRFESNFGGMPYSGVGQMGYDPAKKQYIGTWAESLSPHLSIMEGVHDKESGKLIMRYEAPDMTGKLTQHRHEIAYNDKGYTIEFYMGEGDSAMHSMTIEMTRTSGGDE